MIAAMTHHTCDLTTYLMNNTKPDGRVKTEESHTNT